MPKKIAISKIKKNEDNSYEKFRAFFERKDFAKIEKLFEEKDYDNSFSLEINKINKEEKFFSNKKEIELQLTFSFEELCQIKENKYDPKYISKNFERFNIFETNEKKQKEKIDEIKNIFNWIHTYYANRNDIKKDNFSISFFPRIYVGEFYTELDAIFIFKDINGRSIFFNIEFSYNPNIVLPYHYINFNYEESIKLSNLYLFYAGLFLYDEIISIYIFATKTYSYPKYKYIKFFNNNNNKELNFEWKNIDSIRSVFKNCIDPILNIKEYFENNLLNPIKIKKYHEDILYDLNIVEISNILHKIEKYEIVYIEGHPGSGKSLIYHYLQKHFDSNVYSNIITPYFSHVFSNGWEHTDSIIKKIESNFKKYLLIDEAQQLFDSVIIEKALEKEMKIILIGDPRQKILTRKKFDIPKPHDSQFISINKFSDFYLDDYLNKKKDLKIPYYKIKLENYKRFSENSLKLIEYILCFKDNLDGLNKSSNFEIYYEENIDKFIEYFKNEKNENKRIVTISSTYNEKLCPAILKNGLSIFDARNISYKKYEEEMESKKHTHILNPYHLLSFEYNIVFIYLPNFFSFQGKNISKQKEIFFNNIKNELWILLTRARQKIYIYSGNENTKKYFEEKIQDINNLK